MNRRHFLGASIGSLVLAAAGARPLLAQDSCSLARTAANIEGPYYLPDAPARSALVDHARLTLSGTVRDCSGRPLAGSVLEVWQADPNGTYDVSGDGFRGVLRADADARYRLLTQRPGRYLAGGVERPAHIHVKVHGNGRPPLTTQLYFPGDPVNERDPWHREALEMRMLPLGCSRTSSRHARFDFVL